MRLLADGRTATFVKVSTALGAVLALGACGMLGGSGSADELAIAGMPAYGPQGDYPVVVGDPYSVAGTDYTPEDVLNYDQVGYLAADDAGGNAVTGAHHTLPLPSYVEVTSLESGKTILVRVERRGPMTGTELVALSPGAMAQLEAARGTPVRVRRVNPPEEQRALLRAGNRAEPRMDTPMSLVEILKRRLPGQGSAPVAVAVAQPSQQAPRPAVVAVPAPAPVPAPQPTRTGNPLALPPLPQRGVANATPVPQGPLPAAVQRAAVVQTGFVVQAASFSSSANARNAARSIQGEVSQAGAFYRVHTGPFATRGEAEASLARVRAAGYRDARILTSG